MHHFHSHFHFHFLVISLLLLVFITSTVTSTVTVTGDGNGWVSHGEISGLHALYRSTNGHDWVWHDEAGARWNFSTSEAGSYLHNPCSAEVPGSSGSESGSGSGSVLAAWEGLRCSNSSAVCATETCQITALDLSVGSSLNRVEYGYNLVGSIPNGISKLSALQLLDMVENKLTGTIPHVLGQLTDLTNLYLSFNDLTGTIPATLSSLTNLLRLSIRENILTGTLPPELGALSKLTYFDFDSNFLTGHLPSEYGDCLVSCEYFDMEYNFITGPIPSSFGNMAKLALLDLDSTELSGTLPWELGKLSGALEYLLLSYSRISGTIPDVLGDLTKLVRLDVHSNQFTGSIPLSLGGLSKLTYFSLGKNYLTGPFPSVLQSLTKVELFSLADNSLKGSIPTFVRNYRNLKKFFIQCNRFSRSVEGLFDVKHQLQLNHVDMSDNLLTGHLPEELFKLVAIDTIALSVNCFEGGLDESVCDAEGVKVLSMDGLGAADDCESTLVMPFSRVKIRNSFGGTIPTCLWHFENLTVLHLTGNTLWGTLGNIPSTTRIEQLSVSHNLLSGEIPYNVRNIKAIDLSFNKITGEYFDSITITNESVVKLEINRISGKLPAEELNDAMSVKVLHGNMIDCGTIPVDDAVYKNDYICGSRMFDISIILWGIVVFSCCFLLSVLVLAQSERFKARFYSLSPTLHVRALKQAHYLTFFDHFYNKTFSKHLDFQTIAKFTGCLNETGNLFMKLSLVLICISIPLCFMKMFGGTNYSKYSHDYTWVWSLVHLHGTAPAVVIIVGWTGVVLLCLFWFPRHYDVSRNLLGKYVMTKENYSIVLSMFVLNGIVVTAANALYVASLYLAVNSNVQFMIKFFMAAFKYTTNVLLTPVLCLPIKDPSRNIQLRLRIFIFNNIFLPCLVAFFSSPSCFQGVIVEEAPISSSYTFEYCSLFSSSAANRDCVTYSTTEVEIAPMVPAFLYKYECSSEILTSFIPVYLMVCGMQLLLPFVFVLIFTHFRYEVVPTYVRGLIHGIIWPKYWILETKEKMLLLEKSPLLLLDTLDVVSMDIVFNLSIILTFGFCSPLLAFGIGCACFFKIKMWTLFVGRMLSYVTQKTQSMSLVDEGKSWSLPYTLTALSSVCLPIYAILDVNMTILLRSSTLFLSLLVWDIVADDVGWQSAIWAPILLLLVPIICINVRKVMDNRRLTQELRMDMMGNIDDDIELNEIKKKISAESIEVTTNPIVVHSMQEK